jgi:hypothetical protein
MRGRQEEKGRENGKKTRQLFLGKVGVNISNNLWGQT